MEKKAIITGATSAIAVELCRYFIRDGWQLGLAVRNTRKLASMLGEDMKNVLVEQIDVTDEDSPSKLMALTQRLGGMDLYFHIPGVGWQNPDLEPEKELLTVNTNALGFTRMVGEAYRYFAQKGRGYIVVISSIAGTKGLGTAPAYSATKAFDNLYIQSLEQLANMQHLNIRFTDIRPGFVATPLLGDGKKYPLLMTPQYVAKRIYRAVIKQKHVAVIDWRYAILVFLWRLIPNFLWRRLKIRN